MSAIRRRSTTTAIRTHTKARKFLDYVVVLGCDAVYTDRHTATCYRNMPSVSLFRVSVPAIQSKLIALMKEAVRTSETSVNIYETTQRCVSEACQLHTLCVRT
jgi:hypothetical protein